MWVFQWNSSFPPGNPVGGTTLFYYESTLTRKNRKKTMETNILGVDNLNKAMRNIFNPVIYVYDPVHVWNPFSLILCFDYMLPMLFESVCVLVFFFTTRIFHRVVLKRGLKLYIDVFQSIAVYVFAFSHFCSLKFVYFFVYSLLWKCNFNVFFPEIFPSSTHQNWWFELNIREIVKRPSARLITSKIFFFPFVFYFSFQSQDRTNA